MYGFFNIENFKFKVTKIISFAGKIVFCSGYKLCDQKASFDIHTILA